MVWHDGPVRVHLSVSPTRVGLAGTTASMPLEGPLVDRYGRRHNRPPHLGHRPLQSALRLLQGNPNSVVYTLGH
jgi:hypothetical protein